MTSDQWRLVWIVSGIALVGFAVVSYQSGRHAGIIADWLTGRWTAPPGGASKAIAIAPATGIWTPIGMTATSLFPDLPDPHNWIMAGFPGSNPALRFPGFSDPVAPKSYP